MQSVINLYSARDSFLESCIYAVDDILSEAYKNKNTSDKATIISNINEEGITESYIFDFNKHDIDISYASIKVEITIFDSAGDLVELKCLSEYNPDEHIYKFAIIDLY